MIRLILILSVLVMQFQGCGKNEYEFSGSEGLVSELPGSESPDGGMEAPRASMNCDHLPPRKVCICHLPGDRPEAMHTLIIDRHALEAHLDEHHQGHESDFLGPCPE